MGLGYLLGAPGTAAVAGKGGLAEEGALHTALELLCLARQSAHTAAQVENAVDRLVPVLAPLLVHTAAPCLSCTTQQRST